MTRWRKGRGPVAGLREQRRSRRTGALMSIYDGRAAGFDVDGGRWVTVCEEHGTICNHDTLAQARYWLATGEWCEDCLVAKLERREECESSV